MKNVFTLLLLIIGVTVSSCQENEARLDPGETEALSRIPENSAYTSLSVEAPTLFAIASVKSGALNLAILPEMHKLWIQRN